MQRAYALLGPDARQAANTRDLHEVLCADDTIILGKSGKHVEELASAIEKAGAEVGMTLHWGKTQALGIRTQRPLKDPNGHDVEDKGCMVYLGALLGADGRFDSETSRTVGMATGDLRCLARVWGHARVSRARKLELFSAIVGSKLQYGLASLWLGTAQRRRIDGFHARCLRRILKIPPAYHSRVSNRSVFEQACAILMSEQVLKRQLLMLGKAARAEELDPLRANVFVGGSLQPQAGRYVRRVGRPRFEWTTELLKLAAQRTGGHHRLEEFLRERGDQAETNWKEEVERMFARAV